MTLPFRLAAVDLDDTLLGPDKQIGRANADAVHALRARGVRVVLASGRRHANMLRFHRELGLGPEDLIVSCNGALVRTAETDRVLHERRMPAGLAREILADGARRGVTQNYYHPDGEVYVRARTPFTALYEGRTKSDVRVRDDFLGLPADDDAAPLKIIWVADGALVADLFPVFETRYAGRLYVTVTDAEYLEFMAPGVNKAEGVSVAAGALGLAARNVLAFGDGNNDVPLLAWAGLGIAMSHARDGAKAVAARVAPPGDPETSFARAVAAVLGEETSAG